MSSVRPGLREAGMVALGTTSLSAKAIACATPEFAGTDLSSLRKSYDGASAMPKEVLRELTERAPGLRLWNFYGQTEMAPLATALPRSEQFTHGGSAG
ncbi:AMP-binding protein [Nocardioides alcanivorans]|uniref:AMP-binding protein n=1 Tax=Nocardioides alcanivorans TaxID=2897352 RepID=UPI0035E34D98